MGAFDTKKMHCYPPWKTWINPYTQKQKSSQIFPNDEVFLMKGSILSPVLCQYFYSLHNLWSEQFMHFFKLSCWHINIQDRHRQQASWILSGSSKPKVLYSTLTLTHGEPQQLQGHRDCCLLNYPLSHAVKPKEKLR